MAKRRVAFSSSFAVLLSTCPPSRSAGSGSAWAPDGTQWARDACKPGSNSTDALLRCLAARYELGEAFADFSPETWTPTAEAEAAAMEHLDTISKNAGADLALLRSGASITGHFQTAMVRWHTTGAGMPRIYLLNDGDWEPSCKYMQDSLGYRYSLEHWLRRLFLSMKGIHVVDNVADADYVYLPHCATGIFMYACAKPDLVNAQSTPSRPGRNSTAQRAANRILEYEGNLPVTAVRYTEETYLARLLQNKWAKTPAFKDCEARQACRFLVASVYGRHVWRSFSDVLGDKAIFITHAGLSSWLSNQGTEFYNLHDDLSDSSTSSPDVARSDVGCRAACALHCQLTPPAALADDIVLPWVVAFRWTKRAQIYRNRDILAFYSGTANSCSRDTLWKTFADTFDGELSKLFQRRGRNARRFRKDRVLVFPPEFRLSQQDWSELAYRSHLCIAPDGDSPNTGRLIEVVMHGCVPLIISNRLQPPLHDFVDWRSFAFFYREDAIARLPQILQFLSGPQGQQLIAEKRKNLAQIAYLFDYQRDMIGTMLLFLLGERKRQRLNV